MWKVDDQMPLYEALAYRDKLRVGRCVTRGEAPGDPRLAAAAIDLAESYQRKSRFELAAIRWSPMILILIAACGITLNLADGIQFQLILYTFWALMGVGGVIFIPGTRPKSMTRSLEASKRIAAAAGY